MIKYTKIETVFKRDTNGSKKLIEGDFNSEAVEYLANNQWKWYEKINGTNIGVEWDGHSVSFQGRTEKAEIPKPLLIALENLFGGNDNEELFEQVFGEKHVILYGEGYGGCIQTKSKYRKDCSFILFDVYFPDSNIWLKRNAIENIAKTFNIEVVDLINTGTIYEAIEYVKSHPQSLIGPTDMEGLVCKPAVDMFDRCGKRIIVKIKYIDFVNGTIKKEDINYVNERM